MNRKAILISACFTILIFQCVAGAPALLAQGVRNSAIETKGGIVTLFARDILAYKFCFSDGGYGLVIQDYEIRNRCSDIDFDHYNSGNFTVGLEGGRQGAIVDLGTPTELQRRYNYIERIDSREGFASLRVRDKKAVIVDRDSKEQIEIEESRPLFQSQVKGANTSIKIDHVYLIRLTDRTDKAFELLVKVHVLAYVPGESVTIRWQVL